VVWLVLLQSYDYGYGTSMLNNFSVRIAIVMKFGPTYTWTRFFSLTQLVWGIK